MTEPPQDPTPAQTPFVDTGIAASRVTADLAALTHAGSRPNHEDAFAVFRLGRYLECVTSSLPADDLPRRQDEAGHLLMVGDGIGGTAGGEVASRTAMQAMVEAVMRAPRWALKLDDPNTRESEIQGLMARTRGYLQYMHAVIRERQQADPALARMGTTMTMAYAVGGDLFIMHVGDSRAYVLRGGRFIRITHDHTVAQAYADQGRLGQDEVAEHPLSHVLTRAVGGPGESIEGDTHHRDIEDGDRLVLCSDGLTTVATEDEIAAALAAQPTSAAACRALVDLALARGAPDNVTVIVAGYTVR